MDNGLLDNLRQLDVRNAAKDFFNISISEENKKVAIEKIFNGMCNFISNIDTMALNRNSLTLQSKKTSIVLEDIEKIVCKYYHINRKMLHIRCRERYLVQCRAVICYVMLNRTWVSENSLGKYFGLHHTSVINYIKTIEGRISVGDSVKDDLINIIEIIDNAAPKSQQS